MNEEKKIVCRVCLRYDINRKCLSLFEKHKYYFLAEKINSLTSFVIKEGDGLPDKICPDCLLELENAIQFKEKCERSNEILHSAEFNKTEETYVDVKEEAPEDYLDEDFQSTDLLEIEPEQNLEEQNEEQRKSRAIDLKLICHDCGGSFKSKCKIAVHWKRVHLQEQLFCNRCKRQFKSFRAFNVHKNKGPRSCIAADEMRIEGKGKNRMFYCKSCDYKTHFDKNMLAHIVTHSGARPYVCNICSKGFSQLSSLQGHKEVVHKQYRVEGTCQFCGKHLQGRSRMYKHMLTHRDEKVQCEYCQKLFKSRQSLKVHMERHSEQKRYTCEICAASFYAVTDFCNHKRSKHGPQGSTTCNICGYVSKTYSAIMKHKKKHTSTNICCLVCGRFMESEEMVEHKKYHFGRKFPCTHCKLTYNSKRSLQKHVVKKHCPLLNNRPANKQPVAVKKENPELENATYYKDNRIDIIL